MRVEQIAAKALFEECLDSRVTEAKERHVSLEMDVENTEATLSGDRRLLKTAVNNLIGMAVRRNRPGGKVVIGYRSDPARDSIMVVDNGFGIPFDRLRSIRDLFCRATMTHDYEIDETDIELQGLHIVKDIADIHHGRVGVSSMKGEGSTFTLHLPRRSRGAA